MSSDIVCPVDEYTPRTASAIEEFWDNHHLMGKRDRLEFTRASISLPHFCQHFFTNPRAERKKLLLELWQFELLQYVQDGTLDILINCPRGFGKSEGVAAAAAAIGLREPVSVGVFSPSQRQSNNLMRKIRRFIMTSPFKFMVGKPNNETEMRLTNGSFFVSCPCSETARGYHHHYIFLDEASRMDDNIILGTVMPMIRTPIGRMEIELSTPFGMRGTFWRNYKLAKRNRVYKLFEIDPLSISWMTPERLKKEELKYGPIMSKQEIYAKFLATGSMVFNPDWIEATYDKNRVNTLDNIDPKKHSYCMAVDFGKDRDWNPIGIGHQAKIRFGSGKIKGIVLDYLESFKKTDYVRVQNRILDLAVVCEPDILVPDSTGVGQPITDDLVYAFREEHFGTRFYKTYIKSRGEYRDGFVFSGGPGGTKMPFIDQIVSVYSRGGISVPYHYGVLEPTWNYETGASEGDYEIYLMENELISFAYEILETSIKYGVQSEHDDRVIMIGLLIEGLKNPPFVYIESQGGNKYDARYDRSYKEDEFSEGTGGYII